MDDDMESTGEPSMEMAGAGPRLVSYLVDAIIIGVIGIVMDAVLSTTGNAISTLISLAYYTYFFGQGQTLGMKVMNIKLIGIDRTYPVSYGKGFLRWIGMIVSALIICLGYLWILIDKKNQGWHDKIAGTYVVPA